MPANILYWVLFFAIVVAMIVLDMVLMGHRKVTTRLALLWTGVCFAVAALFAVALYYHGHVMAADATRSNAQLSLEFVTAFVLEESLSLDNLFVFLLIFRFFKVPGEHQHRVLFWGILGAIVMRAVFVGAGIGLLTRFHWVIYIFGVFLLYVGIKLFFQKEERSPEKNWIARVAERHLRLTKDFGNGHFVVRREGRSYLTRLALVLIIIETTDVLFAVDSIPAVLSVTTQPYVAFTSNIFAVLGLRALYLAVSGLIVRFHLLHYGLSIILAFIGGKMLASHWLEVPTHWALLFVAVVLAGTMALSLVVKPKELIH
ncbi:MAG: TerC/Alx family metal homeostasis membrane protein [Acidobacteriota bacterium]|nr:TerC/Alx family metal homeostasis membrane protein [Acidobacteriota bacterium]